MSDDDPRSLFYRALEQAEHQVREVRAAELSLPTPCAEFDVRALLGHLLAVLRKLTHVGNGGDATTLPDPVTGIADAAWATEFRGARADLERTWAGADMLAREHELPWATLPGRDVLTAYAHEFTAHSWDLAHAVGRTGELDGELAALALDWFARYVPAGSRGDGARFGAALPAPDGADAYRALAAYLGRQA